MLNGPAIKLFSVLDIDEISIVFTVKKQHNEKHV